MTGGAAENTVRTEDGFIVATVNQFAASFGNKEDDANARLIAAAPCTHAAALPFLDEGNRIKWMGDKDGRVYLSVTAEEYAALAAAIARATGKEGA